MAVTAYPFGSRINMQVVWREGLSNAPVDPSSVVAKIRAPTGGLTTYTYGVDPELTKNGAGTYRTAFSCSVHGEWHYRFEASGTHVGANERAFSIRKSEFHP